jgi:hypothetical protein
MASRKRVGSISADVVTGAGFPTLLGKAYRLLPD